MIADAVHDVLSGNGTACERDETASLQSDLYIVAKSLINYIWLVNLDGNAVNFFKAAE